MKQTVTNRMSTVKATLLVLALTAACSPTRGCLESQFTLARESRLPKWFTIPQGLSRDDVSMTLRMWSALWGASAEELELTGPNSRSLYHIIGSRRTHPRTLRDSSYPQYDVVTVNGLPEVFEFKRMEPVFYVTDDPQLQKEIDDSSER